MSEARENPDKVAEAAAVYGRDSVPGSRGHHEYLALLGLRSFDTAALLKRLQQGISYAAFERLKNNLEVSAQELARAAMIPQRTLARRKKDGRMRPDESDRLVRIARLYSRAIELFGGDSEAAQRWLMHPNRALGEESPFEMARTEVGAREVEALIGRIEHGVFS